MSRDPVPGDDLIDSRDIIKRCEELKDEYEELKEAVDTTFDSIEEEDKSTKIAWGEAKTALDEWEADYLEELEFLEAVIEEGESYSRYWGHGATLIHEDYFEQYAQDYAEDIGAIGRDTSWPANHIDWEAAAEDLKQDYTEISFGGHNYYVLNS